MAEQHTKKRPDFQRLAAILEKEFDRIVQGTGFGVASLELIVQNGEHQTTRLGGVQTEKT